MSIIRITGPEGQSLEASFDPGTAPGGRVRRGGSALNDDPNLAYLYDIQADTTAAIPVSVLSSGRLRGLFVYRRCREDRAVSAKTTCFGPRQCQRQSNGSSSADLSASVRWRGIEPGTELRVNGYACLDADRIPYAMADRYSQREPPFPRPGTTLTTSDTATGTGLRSTSATPTPSPTWRKPTPRTVQFLSRESQGQDIGTVLVRTYHDDLDLAAIKATARRRSAPYAIPSGRTLYRRRTRP